MAVSTEGASINLMPMMDIFSILITFLLMNFATSPSNYEPSKNTVLPESRVLASLDASPEVILTRNEILVNNKHIAKIIKGDVKKSLISQGAIFPLFKELEKLAKANKRAKINKKNKKNKKIDYLTIEAHGKHSFKLMKRVMLSAQQASFIGFNIMVSKKGS